VIDLSRMKHEPAPVGQAVVRSRGGKRAPRSGPVAVATSLSPVWAALVEPLSHALGAGGYQGERHAIGLALAGALLGRRVPAEQVPVLVAEVCRGAGWDPEHHRVSAIDTVRRWADGHRVSGLSKLPDPVREALELATDTRRAELAAQVRPA